MKAISTLFLIAIVSCLASCASTKSDCCATKKADCCAKDKKDCCKH